MADNRDAVTLDQARRIAKSVAHRLGGTDQALAALDREIERLERRAQFVKKSVDAGIEEIAHLFPPDVFPDPEPGQHGKAVDTCTARGVRHGVNLLRGEVAKVWIVAAAPADACVECLQEVTGLLFVEINRHRWERIGGPLAPGDRSHFARQIDEETRGSLHTVTMGAACGAKFGYQMDSGD